MKDDLGQPKLRLTDKFPFGKYKGQTLEKTMAEDPGYIVWWNNEDVQPEIQPSIVVAAENAEPDDGPYGYENFMD